ncbi:hypothetical protein CpecG_0432 [Chlamydia pecorum MC/MarsBar]|uniref:hypothetical protein n=1 Tax=Chlamydia pecorum TaxID=85991 RepID=UPI0003AE1AA3|nr:hypothetical protein [Chlamydia pecorum]AGW38604.1 hypothetical protein CPE2_0182 [Chlamydia pecorum W73]ETF38828.1 hypothetical protein CpecS_0436 [Chlamydia pecorum VR629]ETF40007.1 hypothetical protein CpecG_0432 [Chlamydia pecorum MC/MarsBar]ETF40539.1 hypothetical protein CpecA_0433 [Chlamydia pecorum IPTaLE]UBV32015.1 hypothetical protein MarsBar_0452 [Chlamydia pecorum]
MKFSRIGGGFVVRPSFPWLKISRGNHKVLYLPKVKQTAKKMVTAIFTCIGLSLIGCAVFAAGACQTFIPSLALSLVGLCFFILAYHQYLKGRVEVSLPISSRKSAAQISWGSFLSLLRPWKKVAPGYFCHPEKPLYVCEGSKAALQAIFRQRKGENHGIFLLQEMDYKAIYTQSQGKNTLSQKAFHLPGEFHNQLRHSISKKDTLLAPLEVLCPESLGKPFPQWVICVNIPGISDDDISDEDKIRSYSKCYLQGFLKAVETAKTSRVVNHVGLCILTPILGVPQSLSLKEETYTLNLSKIAFMQAAESLASETLVMEGECWPITLVLTDPRSVAPLRSFQQKLNYAGINFTELSEESRCCVVM